jgi:sporulation protein YlmC with PRC-barrel domain
MLKMKKISDTFDMKVFTDGGDYFGDVEEAILTQSKVYGWRVRATKNSYLSKVLGSAKGVVVPHQLVKAIGDIFIISKAAVPSYSEEGEEEATATATEAA